MSRVSHPAVIAAIVVCLLAYAGGYLQFAERSNGYARGAGAYYHYRTFHHDWQGYLFVPAAYVEWLIIRSFPEPFLPNPSWAQETQALYVQSPNRMVSFGTP